MICAKDDSALCCGRCDNPVIVMATHDRIEITSKNIELLLPTKIVLVVSDTKELEYYKKYPISIVLHKNKPLGAKWQTGVSFSKRLNPNPLIILGSDDILHETYTSVALELHKNGADFVGLNSWFTHDTKTGFTFKNRYINRNAGIPIGSGKSFSLNLLKRMNWKLFHTGLNKKLDDLSYLSAKNLKANIHIIQEPLILLVKGNWTMLHSTDDFLKSINISSEKVGNEILKEFRYDK